MASNGASCISTIAAFRRRTCCSAPAASRSRWPASTSSGSATRRARWRSAATPTNARASTRWSASSSAARSCEFQGLQWKFADMAIKLESAQLLLYRAAVNADRGLPSAYETVGRQGRLQHRRLRGRARGDPDHGRGGLQQVGAGRVLHAPLPRLDDRRRLDRNSEEPHRRARVRSAVRSAAAEAEMPAGAANPTLAAGAARRRSPWPSSDSPTMPPRLPDAR